MAIALSTLQSQLVIGHWTFDGDAKDQTANGNDETVTGATLTTDRHGNTNQAYYFDGTGDYINLGRDASIQPKSMTVSAWIRLDDTTKHHNIIGCRNSNDGEWGMDIYHHKDFGIITSMGAGANNRAIGHHTLTNLTNDDWHMITFVYDAKNNPYRYATYLDCEFLGYENRTGSSGGLEGTDRIAYTNKNDWVIGAHSQYFSDAVNQGHYFFEGAIDDVVIYNRPLNESEIKILGGKTSSFEPIEEAKLNVYPKPSTGELQIELGEVGISESMKVNIYNGLGQLTFTQNINSNSTTLSLYPQLSKGVYFVEVTQSSGAAILREKVLLE